jgi:hypothetical protein
MFNYGDDGYPQDDDEQFYNETVYNEDYYIEHEREIISDSDLELELGRLENEAIREMREEGLLRPTLVRPGESEPETNAPEPAISSDGPGDLSF